MKRLMTTLAAIAMTTSAALADDYFGLDKMEVAWIAKIQGASFVARKCSNDYEFDVAGAMRWGDQNGVDVWHITESLAAVGKSEKGQDYDRSAIDPRVTRAFNAINQGFEEIPQRDLAKTCKQFIEVSLRDGFMKKK